MGVKPPKALAEPSALGKAPKPPGGGHGGRVVYVVLVLRARGPLCPRSWARPPPGKGSRSGVPFSSACKTPADPALHQRGVRAMVLHIVPG